MSDSRRSRRPDSHYPRSDYDRRDRGYERDRDRDRRSYRSRSRDRRDLVPRSPSPDRYARDADIDRRRHDRHRSDRGRGRDREWDYRAPRYDERDRRDRRYDEDGFDRHRDEPPRSSIRDRDDARDRRRSASPSRSSPYPRSSTAARNGSNYDERRGGREPAQQPRRQDAQAPVEAGEELDNDTAAMQALLGVGAFGSTKGKKIAGNNVGAIRKEKKSEYRQYMNRQGGFNRPLSPTR